MEEGSSMFKIIIGKATGKGPLGMSRNGWEEDIRMDLKRIGVNMRNLIHSAQNRNYSRILVNAALILRVT